MNKEKSAGVIVYKKINEEPHFLIIYSKKNFPGFPKGHMERGEREEDTAKRELFEEVGIKKINLKQGFRESITYTIFDTDIQKEVVFFLGEVLDFEQIKINPDEINEFKIVTFDEAKNILNEQLRNVLEKCNLYIKSQKE